MFFKRYFFFPCTHRIVGINRVYIFFSLLQGYKTVTPQALCFRYRGRILGFITEFFIGTASWRVRNQLSHEVRVACWSCNTFHSFFLFTIPVLSSFICALCLFLVYISVLRLVFSIFLKFFFSQCSY